MEFLHGLLEIIDKHSALVKCTLSLLIRHTAANGGDCFWPRDPTSEARWTNDTEHRTLAVAIILTMSSQWLQQLKLDTMQPCQGLDN